MTSDGEPRRPIVGEVLPKPDQQPSHPQSHPPQPPGASGPTVIYVAIPMQSGGGSHDQPKAPPASTVASRTMATATTLLAVMLAGSIAGCVGGAIGFLALFGQHHLDHVAWLGGTCALLAAGTVAAVLWSARRKSLAVAAAMLGPWVIGWLALVAWYWLRFDLWAIPWLTLALLPLAVLSLWFWRGLRTRTARQAIAYLTGIAIVLAGNGAGVGYVLWDRTDGFGLRGQPSPTDAFYTLAAASCMTNQRFHTGGGRIVTAICPTGLNGNYYQGEHDEKTFDGTLCGEQPRVAFARWWEWNRKYKLEFSIDFFPGESQITGDSADETYTMTLRNAFHPGPEEPYQMTVDKATETWNVHAERVLAGGWKICRIDIPDLLTATFKKLE